MDFGYAYQKLDSARSILMLPHPKGEADSIAIAFHEIHLGLMDADLEDFPEDARGDVQTLLSFINTDGIANAGEGAWMAKARGMDTDEQGRLSHAVTEACFWCREMRDRERAQGKNPSS